ncbi:hypothetical protein OF820_10970 [Oceanotoga sp. DSM 15011]|jgi:hypothetical protein|uniref:Uncharacterized protein n=1 Tax=Oceanotoga teriensis TaxID=515440 RepID=A0AA45HJ59_9BACT|nr:MULTISPECIES: hypothetical protein [Oceanotoga]MDN5341329.1 hypothetical protein [Oceanotoga sp.]MDO7976945.1 hypothetical protein [Oceanotoga teriensis]PWJ95753.1 hypothetical protein C7380_104172 [Oceanotoga teriensis]UYO99586.1 hypothetical protein OF820_10970 [Oceanotoga sp. DSM 15011]
MKKQEDFFHYILNFYFENGCNCVYYTDIIKEFSDVDINTVKCWIELFYKKGFINYDSDFSGLKIIVVKNKAIYEYAKRFKEGFVYDISVLKSMKDKFDFELSSKFLHEKTGIDVKVINLWIEKNKNDKNLV